MGVSEIEITTFIACTLSGFRFLPEGRVAIIIVKDLASRFGLGSSASFIPMEN